MRAPEEKFTAYTEAQWTQIHEMLARFGVKADTKIGVFWWLDYSAGEPRPLRYWLERTARHFSSYPSRPTLKQEAANGRETLDAINVVLGRLNHDAVGHYAYVVGQKDIQAAERALRALAAKLQRQLQTLASVDSASKLNAKQVERNEFLDYLARLWRVLITPVASRELKRKDLVRFLLACVVPVFPHTTEKAITGYLDRTS